MRKEQSRQIKNPVEPLYTFSSYTAMTVEACFLALLLAKLDSILLPLL